MIDFDHDNKFEIPGTAMFEKGLNDLTKRGVVKAFKDLLRLLSVASEPFFRKNMGERYFTEATRTMSMLLWLATSVLTARFGFDSSLAEKLPGHCHIPYLTLFLYHAAHYMTIVTGVLMVFFSFRWGGEGLELMKLYRANNVPYHTRSQGVERWGNELGTAIAFCIITIGLLLFNIYTGIVFIIAFALNAKQNYEQVAAIEARFLDELDKRVEEEFLQPALLGQCRTEVTCLKKPLSNKLNPELRQNMSNAAVGKAVSFPQRTTKLRKGANIGGGGSTGRAGDIQRTDPGPDANVESEPPQMAQIEADQTHNPPIPDFDVRTPSVDIGKKLAPFIKYLKALNAIIRPVWRSKRTFYGLLFVLAVVLLWFWAIPFLESHPIHFRRAAVETAAAPNPPTATTTSSTVEPIQPVVPAPISASSTPQRFPIAAPTPAPPQKDTQALAQAAIAAQKQLERSNLIAKIGDTVAEQDSLAKRFITNFYLPLVANTNRINNLPPSSQESLGTENLACYHDYRAIRLAQVQEHTRYLDELKSLKADSQSDPQMIASQLQTDSENIDEAIARLKIRMDALDKKITAAPSSVTSFSNF